MLNNITDQLPHRDWGSSPESLPAGRGQSGEQSKEEHSCLPPALTATATLLWRRLSGLEEAWITHIYTHTALAFLSEPI